MDRAKPIFEQVNIVAGDLGKSLDFYRLLGVSASEPSADPYHVSGEAAGGMALDLDSPAFARFWNKGWAGQADLVGRVVLGFGLASRETVDEKYAELTAAGHVGLQPPYDAFWGARYGVIEDPNGVAVGLMSPVDPARKVWPPEGWAG